MTLAEKRLNSERRLRARELAQNIVRSWGQDAQEAGVCIRNRSVVLVMRPTRLVRVTMPNGATRGPLRKDGSLKDSCARDVETENGPYF